MLWVDPRPYTADTALACDTSPTETSHHCSHRQADGPEEHYTVSSTETDAPAQIDRLIAFLYSHFGTVEFLSAAELRKNAELEIIEDDSTQVKGEEKEDAYSPKAEEDGSDRPDGDAKAGSEASEPTPKTGLPLGPVIRVRLDEHTADVGADDLVVRSDHEPLKHRVESVIQVALRTITPLAPLNPVSSWSATTGAKRIAVKVEA